MTNPKKRIFLITIAPLYQNTLWVEQLFDFLDIFTQDTILLPRFFINNNETNFESNMILELVKTQQIKNEFYQGVIGHIEDIADFIYDYEQVIQKIVGYFEPQNSGTLEQMNTDLYLMLASQFGNLLEKKYQNPFADFQKEVCKEIIKKIPLIDDYNILILCPIEHTIAIETALKTQYENDDTVAIYRYGEDFLEKEHEPEEVME